MNKIYKVIWNKAKGCYQVASEFAHQQGRSGSTKSAAGRMAAVLAVMALLGSFSVQAQVTDAQFNELKAKVDALEKADKQSTTSDTNASQKNISRDVTPNGIAIDGNSTYQSSDNVYVTNSQGGIAMGSNGTYVKDANEGIAIGNMARVLTTTTGFGSPKAGIAIGAESAVINSRWGVALGARSVVSEADLQNKFENVLSVGASNDGAKAWNEKFAGQQNATFNHYAFTRRIINVSDGVKDSDAATLGQVKEYTNSAVKYDNADKTSVTFGGTNGTALKNVSDIYSSTGKGHIYFYGDNVHIDADNTFTFGKAGVKLSGKDGAALKITGVAKGTDATDAVNKEQLDEVSNKVTFLDNDSVKWDKDANGNVTNAIKGVSFEGEGKLKANKLTGLQDAELDETKDGYDASAAVNVGTLKTAVSSMTGMNSNLGNVVQYQKDGSLLVSKGQNALGVDNNGARLVSSNEQNGVESTASVATSDGSASMTVTKVNPDGTKTTSGFTANKDGSNTIDGNTNINGNLNVNGNFSVNGKDIVTTDDLDKVSGTLNDLDKYAGDKSKLNVTDKDGNKVTNLTDAVNANSDKIAATNKVIGATGEKGALKLTNGATTIESGINQNTAAIQQNSEAINSLGRGLNHLGQEVDNVGAISAALAGLHPLGYDGDGSKFQIAAAVGTYDGTQAAALGGFYHFNRDVMMSLGASSSFGSDNKTAANLGVTFRVGQGSGDRKIADSSTMDTILQRLEKLDKEVAGLKEENKKLTQENEQQKQELEALKR